MRTGSVLAVVGASWLATVIGTPPAVAEPAPAMATLDRGDGTTRLGVAAAIIVFDHRDALYDRAWRYEVFGQYLLPWGLGGYASIPITHAISESYDPVGDPEPSAAGNLDVGLLYVLPAPSRSLVFRAGLALPTAADDSDGALANDASSPIRLTDLALAVPDAFYARLSASALARRGHLFGRADLGFDQDLSGASLSHIVRANLGAGYDFGPRAITLELVTVASADDLSPGEHFRHTFTTSFLFHTRHVHASISIGGPVDQSQRLDAYLAGTLQVPIR